jgi:replicative DNA helicase
MTELQNHIHYSWDLESAVVGIAMLEKTAFGRTHGLIDRDVLYYDNNRVVYDAISELYQLGLPIDILTVVDRIVNVHGQMNIGSFSTAYYVTKLTNIVCSGANLEYHCLILKRMWMEREVIKLTHGGLSLEGDISGKLIQLQTAISRIKSGDYQKEWYDMAFKAPGRGRNNRRELDQNRHPGIGRKEWWILRRAINRYRCEAISW